MAEQLAEVEAIANNPAAPSFENTIVALEKSGKLLGRTSTILFSLLGADSNPARQKVQADYATKLAANRDAVSLNPKLFAPYRRALPAARQARPGAGRRAPDRALPPQSGPRRGAAR